MNDKKCCGHIKGVVCDVKNCAYHDGETRCTAGEITVGPTYASTPPLFSLTSPPSSPMRT